ncbi:MAG: hypothetical protein WCG01_03765 [bacterium]
MNFDQAIKNINRSLAKKSPLSFDQSWIKTRCNISYRFIDCNIKNELGETDWDLLISSLEKVHQKKWLKKKARKVKPIKSYQDNIELKKVLDGYRDKLYTFIAQTDSTDKFICDRISIRLVRTAQKGNELAKNEAVVLINYLVAQWVESSDRMKCWQGRGDLVNEKIEGCIKRFRYAGTFIGYLYRTLEYSGRGLVSVEKFSLDDIVQATGKRRIETFKKCPED